MTTTCTAPGAEHRLLRFVSALDRALDKVADVEPAFMSAEEKREALVQLRRQQDRLAALTVRLLATADDVAADSGARDAATWLAATTRTERGPNTADQRLGVALEARWARLRDGLGNGRVNLPQARVIARALDELPDDLDAGILGDAEEHLVGLAADHRPRELARLGRRILEVVAPDVAEAEEGRRLEAEERRARETTSLHAKRLGDGSTRISIKVPDAVADRLATYLDAFTSPRHDHNDGDTGSLAAPGVVGIPGGQDGDRIPIHRKRGQAFAALLESLDPSHLPEHGGDATTVIVTIGFEQLRASLASAGVVTSDEGEISASEVRRLACTAAIVPAVLGGDGQVLDLGRTARLFNRAQRKALRIRDRHCRAEHCTVPAGWCDAHHWDPWAAGGSTDLDNGVLLCSWHHHRAHDDRYLHQRLPNGDVRFSRRT